eukprot:7198204-Ditylum_brightwellii.AAC.1
MNEDEALDIIGTIIGNPTCIFEAPASSSNKDMQLYAYALDFSFKYHGNPHSQLKLHPDT